VEEVVPSINLSTLREVLIQCNRKGLAVKTPGNASPTLIGKRKTEAAQDRRIANSSWRKKKKCTIKVGERAQPAMICTRMLAAEKLKLCGGACNHQTTWTKPYCLEAWA
jgi:hypothetical protein